MSVSKIAGPCPRNAAHPDTLVYCTVGRTRYCKCNACGETWKVIGPAKAPSEPQSGPCPRNGGHKATSVYRTKAGKNHCKCNDCGANWTERRAD